MSIQKLTYQADLSAVYADATGNLITDAAGNLGIVVPPIIISPGAAFADDGMQGKSCWYGSIEYGGNTYDWSGCTDNGDSNPVRIETEGFLLRFANRGSDGFAAITNLRNLAKAHDSLTVKVYAGNNFVPETKKVDETEEFIQYSTEHDATYHGIGVQWGEQSIEDFGYQCPGSNYYVGSVTINFSDLTVTLNTDDVTWYSGPFKCGEIWDEPIDPDVDIITVVAPIAWCNTEEGTIVYTELSAVQVGNRVWSNEMNSVPVPPGVDEESAKNAAAMSFVGTTEERHYIITQSGAVYWEDVDFVPPADMINEIQVKLLRDPVTGDELWARGYGMPSENNCKYRASHVRSGLVVSPKPVKDFAEQLKFSAWGGELVSSIVCSTEHSGLLWFDNGALAASDDSFSVTAGTTECDHLLYDYYTLSVTRKGKTLTRQSGALIHDVYLDIDDAADRMVVIPMYENKGFGCDDNDIFVAEPYPLGSNTGDVRKGSYDTFHIDGGVYSYISSAYGWVYVFPRRWVLSPCSPNAGADPEEIFTGEQEDIYYLSIEDLKSGKSPGQSIAKSGNGVYYIVDEDGTKLYYGSGGDLDMETNTTIDDEEFE